MDRQTLIMIVDGIVQVAALLFVLLCAKNIFSAMKNRYVFINGKKASRSEEAVGYWLVIVSWIVVLAVFASVFISNL